MAADARYRPSALATVMTKKLAGPPINSLKCNFVSDDPANEDITGANRKKLKLANVATPHCMDSQQIAQKGNKNYLAENNVMLVVTQDGWLGPSNSCKLCGLTIQEMMQVSMQDKRLSGLTD